MTQAPDPMPPKLTPREAAREARALSARVKASLRGSPVDRTVRVHAPDDVAAGRRSAPALSPPDALPDLPCSPVGIASAFSPDLAAMAAAEQFEAKHAAHRVRANARHAVRRQAKLDGDK